jgi:arsenite methyltransferase
MKEVIDMSEVDVREQVKERYGSLAKESTGSCCTPAADTSCCGGGGEAIQQKMSMSVGYSEEELGSLPEGANLGVGCGNPLAFSAVKEGDTVVDLGSGAGIDCFLAAQKVGGNGQVIGVDMTPEMLAKARLNAEKGGYTNVEFREGVIE